MARHRRVTGKTLTRIGSERRCRRRRPWKMAFLAPLPDMNEFDGSTLWRISAFQRVHDAAHADAFAVDGRPTLLPTTLLADLQQLQDDPVNGDVLEVIAACVRHREPALLYLGYGAYVWPVTIFPREFVYHSPRDVAELGTGAGLAQLSLINAEPPGVRPPGDAMHERVAHGERYRPLEALLWAVALHGPRPSVLSEISGRVAYKLVSSGVRDLPSSLGALGPAVARLRQEAAPLRDIANWPGMSLARASRLLNALYLTGALMISRSHPAASRETFRWRGLFGRGR
jgi:hypothetical protein